MSRPQSRLPLLPETPDDRDVRAMFEEVRGHWPAVPNLYKTLGHSPQMLRAWLDIAWPLRLEAKTPRRLREMMILRGAEISRTAYEWAHHVPLALQAGVTQEEVDALYAGEVPSSASAAERAALQLAEEVTRGPGASPECLEDLKAHFNDAEIIELTLTASFYVCVGRMLMSLGVPLEEKYEEPWPGR
ncbi:MAG: carboxymuconolactone decarboxylase family protein [Pseudomonadota bacterium]